MSLEVKNNLKIKKNKEILISLAGSVKPIDLSKFASKLKLEGDPIELQREWRDE